MKIVYHYRYRKKEKENVKMATVTMAKTMPFHVLHVCLYPDPTISKLATQEKPETETSPCIITIAENKDIPTLLGGV